MGLFGGSDDSEDDEVTDESGTSESGASEGSRDRGIDRESSRETGGAGGGRSIGDRVASRVEEARNASGSEREERLRGLVTDLDRGTEERIVAARALARIAGEDERAIDAVADRAIDRLAERDLARPIAEEVLASAADLEVQGVDRGLIVEGTLEALEEASARITGLRVGSDSVPGGGAGEIALASELREHAGSARGRQQLVIEAAADAFEGVPTALARRAGVDPIDATVDMRTKHEGGSPVGIDETSGDLEDAEAPGMTIPADELRLRITDGTALGLLVLATEGTVSQLETLAGYRPYP